MRRPSTISRSPWVNGVEFRRQSATIENALRIDQCPDAHFNLGVALEQVSNVHEAIIHYQEVSRIAPNYRDAQNRLARLNALQ